MKIENLTLQNFRQFYGRHEVEFADPSEGNVNFVFAGNGAGKTTLLNAFTWCLYGETTPALENPDQLLSKRAISEATSGSPLEGSVTTVFSHEGRQYIVRRSREGTAGPGEGLTVENEGDLEVQIISQDGETRKANAPQDAIDQVLPERLYDFFFFDGERIERLTGGEAYKDVQKAVTDILGLKLLDRCQRHLGGKVEKELNARLSDVGDPDIQKVVDKLDKRRTELEEVQADLEEAQENKSAAEKELEAVSRRLQERQETRELEEKLKSRKNRRDNLKGEISRYEENLSDLLNEDGFKAFCAPLLEECSEVLEESREKGEIPTDIKRQFVEDLLERGVCICGTELSRGSEHHKKVEGWLDQAGDPEVERRVHEVSAQLKSYQQARSSFFEKLKRLQKRKKEARDELHEVKEKIKEIDKKIEDKGGEDIDKLVSKRKRLKGERDSASQKIHRKEARKEDLQSEIKSLENERDSKEQDKKEAERVRRQLSIVSEAKNFFASLEEFQKDQIRRRLDDRIEDVYRTISFKDYWPELTENFELVLKSGPGRLDEEGVWSVSKSTGENQVLGLSFIGAIVDYAKEMKGASGVGDPTTMGFTGGSYPIVMDSPFGNLDDNYREAVAEGLPDLAEQLVIFVTKSQGAGPVLQSLIDEIGALWVLDYTTTKEEVDEETVEIEGREYPLVTRGSGEWDEVEFRRVR